MKPKELVKLLEIYGFLFVRQNGSHAIYRNIEKKMVIVPMHNRDIPQGTLNAILKDANIKEKIK